MASWMRGPHDRVMGKVPGFLVSWGMVPLPRRIQLSRVLGMALARVFGIGGPASLPSGSGPLARLTAPRQKNTASFYHSHPYKTNLSWRHQDQQ